MKRLGGSSSDDAGEQERGAHLQLAQRHRKIVAGSFKGRKALEPEFATPGVVGKLTAAAGQDDVEFDHADDGIHAIERECDTCRYSVDTGSFRVGTPEKATPQGEAIVTTFEKLAMSVILTIENVKNPKKETMFLAASSDAATTAARLTTLSASGGVIDGPTRVEVARISELRERDFEVLTKVLDAEAADNPSTGDGIPIDRIPELLRRAGLTLSDELYQKLVIPCFPVRDAVPVSDPEVDNTEPANTPRSDKLSREELLNVFAVVYAPAYKYGQELRLACGRGHLELVREWISRGCNPNAGDATGWSALHYAADYGQLDVLNLLVEMTTCQQEYDSNSESKSMTLEINARDGHGWTPLMCAAANGHIDIIQKLLALGASILLTSTEHRSALHWAAIRGMATAASLLLAAGADVNQVDRCGWTPLHCATLHGNTNCATILTDKGAKPAAKDKLDYAAQYYGDAAFFPSKPLQLV
ncbi:Activating molecule in BECN1-regulated autophagy protein 1 [Phytophthora nicotianae]|uniref:Activating molecule in BECN1-regulated autophagy protein 1 n=1 Tax=Phytophthora nicotianae TaxID=4792 RepID=A0A0W8D7X6_PHYNI|nr:Activating molecule in BECN1-regulated autophagy protein 1 [Phytophthora nicotianae]